MKRYLVATSVLSCLLAAGAIGFAAVASSSGCYRWHSCPSATGSYVCGDTGHCGQCPDNRYCGGGLPKPGAPPSTGATAAPQPAPAVSVATPFVPAKQSKTSGCAAKDGLPDPACTPGSVLAVTAAQVCKSGYSKSVRNVTTATKNLVYKDYGIAHHATGQYEVDHLISLELGGSNDIANLWPEAAKPAPGFHEKDKVENWLHKQVCGGAMTLNEAQREIATAWEDAYAAMDATSRKANAVCVGGCP